MHEATSLCHRFDENMKGDCKLLIDYRCNVRLVLLNVITWRLIRYLWFTASQLKNVTAIEPVPSYTVWWQRHIGVNNLPKVVTQLCPGGNWTHDLLITDPMWLCYHGKLQWQELPGANSSVNLECGRLSTYHWKMLRNQRCYGRKHRLQYVRHNTNISV